MSDAATKWIVVHFRSGRVITLKAVPDLPPPDDYVSKLSEAIPANLRTLAIGANLIFAREVERIEFFADMPT